MHVTSDERRFDNRKRVEPLASQLFLTDPPRGQKVAFWLGLDVVRRRLDVDEIVYEDVFFSEYILQSKSPCAFFPLTLSLYYITSNFPSCCRCPSKKKERKKKRLLFTEREDGGRAM